jgi:hypothetical protein
MMAGAKFKLDLKKRRGGSGAGPGTPVASPMPGPLFAGAFGQGFASGIPAETVRVEGQACCGLWSLDPDFETIFQHREMMFWARAKGGIDRIELVLEGGEAVVVRDRVTRTWTDVLGNTRTDKVYVVPFDPAPILALGFANVAMALSVTAFAKNSAITSRTLYRRTVYVSAQEYARTVSCALTPGFPGADYIGLGAAMNFISQAGNRGSRSRILLIEDGEYAYGPIASIWDDPGEWPTIQVAQGVNAVIGGGLVGGVPSRSNLGATWFKGNIGTPLVIDRSRLGYTGGTPFTLRQQSEGRLAFEGCRFIASELGGPDVGGVPQVGSGVGKYALINGRQTTPQWIFTDASAADNHKRNTYFMECDGDPVNGLPAGAISRYSLARYCDMPDVSGSAYECSQRHAMTWRCRSRGAGGYTSGLRLKNPAFTVTYTGTGAAQFAVAGANGGVTSISLIVDGVASTYTVYHSAANRSWSVSAFVAWANTQPGWQLIEPETPCRLSIEFLSRPELVPASPFGTVNMTRNVPVECISRMDIHAVSLPMSWSGVGGQGAGVENVCVFGFDGKMIGAAPIACGDGHRRDVFIENSSWVDCGLGWVDPLTGLADPIQPQSGYLKAIQDEHVVQRAVSFVNSDWNAGSGYSSLGHNVVDRVIGLNISPQGAALTAPGVGRTHANCVSFKQTDGWFATLGAVNSKGYGSGVTGVSTITVEDVFDDPYGDDARPKAQSSTAGARLPDGTYSGRYRPDGSELFEEYFA